MLWNNNVQLPEVVALHLVVKDLGLTGLRTGDEVLVQETEDLVADTLQLDLDLKLTVVLD